MYCTVCQTDVTYDSGKDPLGIQRHMAKYHQILLDSYDDSGAAGRTKERKAVRNDALFPKKPEKHGSRMAKAVNQKTFNDKQHGGHQRLCAHSESLEMVCFKK